MFAHSFITTVAEAEDRNHQVQQVLVGPIADISGIYGEPCGCNDDL